MTNKIVPAVYAPETSRGYQGNVHAIIFDDGTDEGTFVLYANHECSCPPACWADHSACRCDYQCVCDNEDESCDCEDYCDCPDDDCDCEPDCDNEMHGYEVTLELTPDARAALIQMLLAQPDPKPDTSMLRRAVVE